MMSLRNGSNVTLNEFYACSPVATNDKDTWDNYVFNIPKTIKTQEIWWRYPQWYWINNTITLGVWQHIDPTEKSDILAPGVISHLRQSNNPAFDLYSLLKGSEGLLFLARNIETRYSTNNFIDVEKDIEKKVKTFESQYSDKGTKKRSYLC
ncbi:hypothetical protein O9G_005307 [Rozella allomycis CSF55]|uniref:Uncharacterized protein n=1 Tax=Rozella allomycis (strain CSF55) TaxID=988480 RepID=A0A075ATY1_ROZAC|nr:hypothetical protein O9G_005307 [Rozella allomycis CSF55]|eukprot:EPZ32002.1 hypothetical protein O9G_005307 [Rozella allomycis CSF55]